MQTIDLNCDMGESFGAWKMGSDAELMNYVTSANIACGFHAGDPSTMRKTVEIALERQVAIGAHPGYPDLQGFGRRDMSLTAGEVYDTVVYQIAALKGICEASGTKLHHVKPHGALYNQAARSKILAAAVVRAVKAVDSGLILYGLSGSHLIDEAENAGLKTASEVFVDRTYQPDGSLTPRTELNALISEWLAALAQAMQMVKEGSVTALTGERVPIKAETICVHGDGPRAVEFASGLRKAFTENGVEMRTVGR